MTAFRTYDVQLGRFHQPDPLAELYQSINPYQYAFNNPSTLSDPTGLMPVSGGPGECIQCKDKPGHGSDVKPEPPSGPRWYEDAYWEGGNSRGYQDLVRPAIPLFPPTALVNSGYKYITGGGIDGTKADAWDYALGWLDLIPEGVEIKLAAKYTLTAAFKAIVIKQAVKKLPVAVPSFKKVSFDWVHIFDNHSDWGKTAQQSGIKDIFEGLDEKQIKEVVTGAYQNIIWHAKSAAQKGVYQMRGKYKSWTVEFWVNTTTKTVETAYPLGRKP